MSYLPRGQQEMGGVWDSVKTFASGALDVVKGQAASDAQAQAYKDMLAQQQAQKSGSGMPSWVVPAAIGGGVLVVLLMMKKKG